MSPNPRAKQLSYSDWKPLRSSRAYRDNYDSVFEPTIEGTNSRYRLVKREEVPFHSRNTDCGGECEFYPNEIDDTDFYSCNKCGMILTEEDGEIEWKPKPNDQT